MVAAAAAVYGVAVSPAFAVRTVEMHGADLTGDAAVLAALDLSVALPSDAPAANDVLSTDASTGESVSSGDASTRTAVSPGASSAATADGENVFTLRTAPLAARVVLLPTVASATVTAALPDAIRVDVVEREPILAWSVGDRSLLVDRDGLVLLDASAVGIPPAAARVARSLPAIVDTRRASATLAVGDHVDALDLDVATRLASLQPKDLGTRAKVLDVHVSDADGWVVGPADGWEAIFGLYTATVRPPDIVPDQVRLLRSLIGGREAQLDRVYLASGEAGTYTLR